MPQYGSIVNGRPGRRARGDEIADDVFLLILFEMFLFLTRNVWRKGISSLEAGDAVVGRMLRCQTDAFVLCGYRAARKLRVPEKQSAKMLR